MDQDEFARDAINGHLDAVAAVLGAQVPALLRGAQLAADALMNDGRILVCGCGGSATVAQNLALKLLDCLERDRPGLPAICLGDSATIATGIALQHGIEEAFARQLRALARPDDVLVAISVSGSSPATVQAVVAARERGMRIIALTGQQGGALADRLGEHDIEIRVPTASRSRAEEVHLLLAHILCELVERELFGA
jgi:D-sedoheptulose 7-phosphate isomerase